MTYRTTMGTISMYGFIGNSAGNSVCLESNVVHVPLLVHLLFPRSLFGLHAFTIIHIMSTEQSQSSSHTIVTRILPPIIIRPNTTHNLQPNDTCTLIRPFLLRPNTTVHYQPTDPAHTNFKSCLRVLGGRRRQ